MEFGHQVGFATLVALDPTGEQVPHRSPGPACGVLYAMRPDEVEDLKRKERGYDLTPVTVERIDDGDDSVPSTIDAVAFISSRWHRLPSPVTPTRRYAELVLTGAELRGLPEGYVQWLRAERDGSRFSSNVPASHYDTPSRRTANIFAAALAVTFVGRPVVSRVWQCRTGWEPGTSCEAFFPSALQAQVPIQ